MSAANAFAVLVAFTSAASAMPHRTVDLRTHSEPDGSQYSISICARPSPGSTQLPGHAFVGYSRLPLGGGREYLAIGHTSDENIGFTILTFLGLKPAVEGSIQEEIFTSTQEQCLVLLVNRTDYDASLDAGRDALSGALPSFTQSRQTILRYTLGSQDCVGFILGVLEPYKVRGSVRVPNRQATELPLAFLRRIIDAN